MSGYNQFTKSSLIHSIAVIGETASIGGNQFRMAFDESDMNVTNHIYGDEDDVTTTAVCMKAELSNKPVIGETLVRTEVSKSYVIIAVQSDVNSYELQLREKDV